jgi:hypothetical protein
MAVARVTQNRMADAREMSPNLVCPSGLDLGFDEASLRASFEDANMGDRLEAFADARLLLAALPGLGVEAQADGLISGTFVDEGLVALLDLASAQGLVETTGFGATAGEEHEAGGIAIEAADGREGRLVGHRRDEVEPSVVMSGADMNGQARGLGSDDEGRLASREAAGARFFEGADWNL